ncbi:hypothetical protein D5S18_08230, partial [Nocardia panacis]
KKLVPHWDRFFDPRPDALAAATRLILGAAAGGLFHGQVTTMLAAVAVGASAPALLGQMGAVRSVGELAELADQKKPE